jgi:hypothetical protein
MEKEQLGKASAPDPFSPEYNDHTKPELNP